MFKHCLAAAALLCAAAAAPAHAKDSDFGPALYVVRDADSTMYIYGTLHIRKPNQPWGGPNAVAALASADEVWLETQETADDQAIFMRHAMSERPLAEMLSPEDYARYAAQMQAIGMPPAAFDQMRPWFVALMLQIVPLMQQGYDPEWGADARIQAYADEHGKPVRIFETTEQQIRFLADRSEETQAAFLIDSIAALEEGMAELFELEAAWERGDLDAILHGDVTEMRAQFPELYDVLLVQRNNAWMEVLTQEMAGAGVDFVAVGAAHLVGEHGLVEQFRARGFTIERVPAAE